MQKLKKQNKTISFKSPTTKASTHIKFKISPNKDAQTTKLQSTNSKVTKHKQRSEQQQQLQINYIMHSIRSMLFYRNLSVSSGDTLISLY